MARNSNSKFGRTFGLTRHLAERANRTSKALHGPTAPDNSSLALQGTSTALPTSLPSFFSKALRALNFGGITPRTSLSSSKFRGLLLALSVPLFCTFGIFGTSMAFGTGSAFAGEPWWHLTSGSRPGDLTPGPASATGVDAEYEVTCTSHQLVILVVTSHQRSGGGGFFCPLSHEELQSKFEEPNEEEGGEGFGIGPGNVEVPSGDGSVGDPYRIVFTGELEYQPVELGTFTTSSATVTEKAKGSYHGPELVLAAANLGDASVHGEECVKVAPLAGRYTNSECSEPGPAGEPNVGEYEKTTVKLTDHLPPHLRPLFIEANTFAGEESSVRVPCVLSDLTCEYKEALLPFHQFEVTIPVEVLPGASSAELNEVSISGGGAPGKTISRNIAVGESTPFGIASYELTPEEEGGSPSLEAGKHPFQVTGSFTVNQQTATLVPPIPLTEPEHQQVTVPALAKDTAGLLPPGLIGNPSAFAKCQPSQFFAEDCPPASVVGVTMVTLNEPNLFHGIATFTVPIVNMEPAHGQVARFGFLLPVTPVYLEASVRTGGDYGVTLGSSNISQTAALLAFKLTFWGTPGAAAHDFQRGASCLGDKTCVPLEENEPPPFLVMPTQCNTKLSSSIEADSWLEPKLPGQRAVFPETPTSPLGTLVGCNHLAFAPELKVTPDDQAASTPTGLNVDVHVPEGSILNSTSLAQSNVKQITVTLPAGVTLNPSAADGLQACTGNSADQPGVGGLGTPGDQIGYKGKNPETGAQEFTEKLPESTGAEGEESKLNPGVNFCPEASKIATVKIKSPLLPPNQPIEGGVYLASPQNFHSFPQENPFDSLLAMYIVAEDKVSGATVKLPGKVELGGEPGVEGLAPGQIRSTFENTPQLAFEDAEVHFFGGERAPLASPARCGAYTTTASYVPWSAEPATATSPGDEAALTVTSTATFNITSGPGGTPCPGASLPFKPSLESDSTSVNAGSFSDLTTTLSRPDGDQPLQSVTLHYPPGLSGSLTGVPLCGEAEAGAGTCGPESLIGETIVSVGVGGEPFTVTGGRVYLTGPYHGAPFGLSIVNPAKAGPFDLQEGRPVVVRAKVEVDPYTAALTVTTNLAAEGNAIPTLIEGFALQIQHVNVLINRPGFTFNPTSCSPAKVTGTLNSSEGASAPIEDQFQVTNCANLKFEPKISISTQGKTSKADGASLTYKVAYPHVAQGTDADIHYVKVELPKALPSRLTTLQKACTAEQFEANPEGCPGPSVIGHAKAVVPNIPVPVEGPVYFVSHGGEAFPSLEIVLKGYGVKIILVGTTFISKSGITSTTLKTVPDNPVYSFELTLPEGKYSALAANGNLCTQKLVMPNEYVAQNGLPYDARVPIAVTGCKKLTPAQVRAQKLKAALKACHKDHNKGKREACAKAARKNFGPVKKAKKAIRVSNDRRTNS